ncbi:MAG: WG repeat-containing protein [Cytophagaceae bacterium]|jgi:hypothetical protein|nr:WG repeat-containing protein [Cytophagaceae bacterium]
MRPIVAFILFLTFTGHSQLLIPFEKDSLWGYCKRESKVTVINPQYANAWPFKNGKAIVQKNKQYFIIASNNKILSSLPYPNIVFKYGLAPVKIDGKYGFIDYSGQLVIPALYNRVSAFNDLGICEVRTNNQIVEINRKGEIVKILNASDDEELKPTMGIPYFDKPTFVTKAFNGIAKYSYRGYVGYADTSNKIITRPKYEIVSELFIDSLCNVTYFTKSDKWNYYRDYLNREFASANKDSTQNNKPESENTFEISTVYSHEGYIDMKGVEYFESSFNPDKFVYEEFRADGTLFRKCSFVYDLLEGTYTEYDDKNVIKLQYEFKKGVRIK